MKKLLAPMLAFLLGGCLTAGCAVQAGPAGIAETDQAAEVPAVTSSPAPETAEEIRENVEQDLDQDGAPDKVDITVDEEAYTTLVSVTTASGVYTDLVEQALMGAKYFCRDTEAGDGFVELYVTGDTASDDYMTCVYRLENGRLRRAEIYNEVVSCDGRGHVTATAHVNVLGTWGGSCDYKLMPDFTFALDSPYTILRYDGDFAERKLTTRLFGLPVRPVDGGQETVNLPEGTELFPTETDQNAYVLLSDAQGVLYRLEISKPEADWQWHIGDFTESDWFGELMYAG